MHSESFDKNPNNFDALRIVAALTVLAVHQYALMGQTEPGIPGMVSWGLVAVWVFFVISGYLVAQSWCSDPHVLRFALRRVLRIWPALTVVVVLSAFVLGPWITTRALPDYWHHAMTWDYLQNLLMQSRYFLPGVLEDAPGNKSINGSLWTIPYEVSCYVVLAVVGVLGLHRGFVWQLVWALAFLAWYFSGNLPDQSGTLLHYRELGLYFFAGAALFCLRAWWQPHRWLVMVVLWGMAALLWFAQWRYLALALCIPITVLAVGTSSWPGLRRAGRLGDPSYGLYLWAFPIQQLIVHFTYPRWSYGASLVLAVTLTMVAAFASWYLIEKPALRWKPRKR